MSAFAIRFDQLIDGAHFDARNDALDGASFTGEFKMSFQKLETVPLWQTAVYVNGLPVNAGTAPIWGIRNIGFAEPPKVGERVKVTMNGLGPAVVVGYAIQDGFLGVLVKLESPPEWHVKQNFGRMGDSLVFGPEIAPYG